MQPPSPHKPYKEFLSSPAREHDQQFLFPILPFDNSIQLQSSRLIPKSGSAMAFQNDDGSVDGMSSIGEPWEEIDERNSDNGAGLSRQLTPMSERLEPDYGVSSFMSTNSEPPGSHIHASQGEISANEQDESMFTPTVASLQSATWSDSQAISKPGYLRLQEEDAAIIEPHSKYPVKKMIGKVMSIQGKELDHLCKANNIQFPALEGDLHMILGSDCLNLNSAFELMYVGPKEMKSVLIEKIGAVLTARTGDSSRSAELDSSRVTVVPVSEFHNDASPEVVLIDSFGVDMKISECQRATLESNDTISLTLTNQPKKVLSYPSWNKSSYSLARGFAIPDVALVYIPESEPESSKSTREAAAKLFSRHNIPFLTICSNTIAQIRNNLIVDDTLPHIAVNTVEGTQSTTLRLPIDLNTLLALDASQLNRSLAHSIRSKGRRISANSVLPSLINNLRLESAAILQISAAKFKDDLQDFRDGFPGSLKTLWFSWIAQIRGRPAYYSVSLILLLVLQIIAWIVQPGIMTNPDSSPKAFKHFKTEVLSFCMPGTSITPTTLPTHPPARRMDELTLRHRDSMIGLISASQNTKTQSYQKDMDKYKASVLGDSHVIIIRENSRATSQKFSPTLNFSVRRNKQQLVHDVSKISDGVHVIELLAEDAYGRIDISAWSNGRVKVNETFSVDFGTPWLKISSWLNAAQAMNHQARKDLISARLNLSEVFKSTKNEVTVLWRWFDQSIWGSKFALVLDSYGDMLKLTGSKLRRFSEVFTSSADHVYEMRLALDEKLRRVRLGHQVRMIRYKVSGKLTTTATYLAKAGRSFQKTRSRNFGDFEKKLLQTWWKLSGPPALDKKKEQSPGQRKDRTFGN